jgi:hypothetical protein
VYVRPSSLIRGGRAARSGTGRTGDAADDDDGDDDGDADGDAVPEADADERAVVEDVAEALVDPVDPVAPVVGDGVDVGPVPDVAGNWDVVQV